MTPPAVAPPAPVSAPTSAPPPGSGSPSGAPPSGGGFGEILDSARTATAEGPKHTGGKSGEPHSSAKASDGTTKPSTKRKPSSEAAQGATPPEAAQLTAATPTALPSGAPAPKHTHVTAEPLPATGASSTPATSTPQPADTAAEQSGAPATPAADLTQQKTETVADTKPKPTAALATASQVNPSVSGPEAQAKPDSRPAAGKPVAASQPPLGSAVAGQYAPQPTPSTTPAVAQPQVHVYAKPQLKATAGLPSAGAEAASLPGTKPQTAPGSSPAGSARAAVAQAALTATDATSAQGSGQSAAGNHAGHDGGEHPAKPEQPSPAGAPGAGSPGAGQPAAAAEFSIGTARTTGPSAQPSAALAHDLHPTVTLREAVDAVKASFTAANQAGISTARITLSPESLGGIRISLSQTPDGLVARVATDHPEAAMTLQQSAGDLKRSLEESGMSLLRLDIGSSGQQSQSSFAGSAGDGSQAGPGSSATHRMGGVEDDVASTPTELTVELAKGSLVNVLA
jgi:flagellar hook-length control protein FliK